MFIIMENFIKVTQNLNGNSKLSSIVCKITIYPFNQIKMKILFYDSIFPKSPLNKEVYKVCIIFKLIRNFNEFI